MRNALRYEMMAVFVNNVENYVTRDEDRKDILDYLRNDGYPFGQFTEEERKFMLVVLNGIEDEGEYDMYRIDTKEQKEECAVGIMEYIHNGYEGYSEGEKMVIRFFLQDLGFYIKESMKYKESQK